MSSTTTFQLKLTLPDQPTLEETEECKARVEGLFTQEQAEQLTIAVQMLETDDNLTVYTTTRPWGDKGVVMVMTLQPRAETLYEAEAKQDE